MLALDKHLAEDLAATKSAFVLYIIFLISFFIHVPDRIPGLGLIRPDFLLVLYLFYSISTKKLHIKTEAKISKLLYILLAVSILTIPLATWPGSVISRGIPSFIKAIIFFIFTYKLVLNEQRLIITINTFLLCNTFRVLEPLYLHETQGYWGSQTTFGWDQVGRLAGAPSDVINGNGLAFVIASIIPFYHYLLTSRGFFYKLIYWGMLPIFLYTMSLTLSRSGIVAVVVIYAVIFLKSKRKGILTLMCILGVTLFFGSLDSVQRDRYLSIVDPKDTQSGASAEGRKDGWIRDFEVGMIKPIFGHGLGTSAEANWNFAGETHRSHNLWLEVFQELGLVGLIIFFRYTLEIYKGFMETNRVFRASTTASPYLRSCLAAMQVWLMMNILFSFFSYGLSSYEWYLFGGFSAVIARLAMQKVESPNN